MQPLGTDQAPGSPGGGTGGGDSNLRQGSRGTGDGRKPGRRWSPWLTGLLLVLLAAAVAFGKMSAAGAIAAAVFGGAALFFAESLVRSLDRGERASFESAWGGLGGGLGGWRLTTPLVYLVATAVFGTLLMVVAVQEMPPRKGDGTEDGKAQNGTQAPSESKGADDEEGDTGEAAKPVAGAEGESGDQGGGGSGGADAGAAGGEATQNDASAADRDASASEDEQTAQP